MGQRNLKYSDTLEKTFFVMFSVCVCVCVVLETLSQSPLRLCYENCFVLLANMAEPFRQFPHLPFQSGKNEMWWIERMV